MFASLNDDHEVIHGPWPPERRRGDVTGWFTVGDGGSLGPFEPEVRHPLLKANNHREEGRKRMVYEDGESRAHGSSRVSHGEPPVTFTATVPAGTAVDHFVFTFSDANIPPRTTGNPSTVTTFTSRGQKIVRVDVFGVGGGLIGSNTITLEVS
jgi:hypothetical protein